MNSSGAWLHAPPLRNSATGGSGSSLFPLLFLVSGEGHRHLQQTEKHTAIGFSFLDLFLIFFFCPFRSCSFLFSSPPVLDLAVGGSVAGHGDRRRRELLGGWKELKKTAGPPLRLVEELEKAPKGMTKAAGGSELGLWRREKCWWLEAGGAVGGNRSAVSARRGWRRTVLLLPPLGKRLEEGEAGSWVGCCGEGDGD